MSSPAPPSHGLQSAAITTPITVMATRPRRASIYFHNLQSWTLGNTTASDLKLKGIITGVNSATVSFFCEVVQSSDPSKVTLGELPSDGRRESTRATSAAAERKELAVTVADILENFKTHTVVFEGAIRKKDGATYVTDPEWGLGYASVGADEKHIKTHAHPDGRWRHLLEYTGLHTIPGGPTVYVIHMPASQHVNDYALPGVLGYLVDKHTNSPWILLGDLNYDAQKTPERWPALTIVSPGATHKAGGHLDYAIHTPNLKVAIKTVSNEVNGQPFSDHMGIFLDLEWPSTA